MSRKAASQSTQHVKPGRQMGYDSQRLRWVPLLSAKNGTWPVALWLLHCPAVVLQDWLIWSLHEWGVHVCLIKWPLCWLVLNFVMGILACFCSAQYDPTRLRHQEAKMSHIYQSQVFAGELSVSRHMHAVVFVIFFFLYHFSPLFIYFLYKVSQVQNLSVLITVQSHTTSLCAWSCFDLCNIICFGLIISVFGAGRSFPRLLSGSCIISCVISYIPKQHTFDAIITIVAQKYKAGHLTFILITLAVFGLWAALTAAMSSSWLCLRSSLCPGQYSSLRVVVSSPAPAIKQQWISTFEQK